MYIVQVYLENKRGGFGGEDMSLLQSAASFHRRQYLAEPAAERSYHLHSVERSCYLQGFTRSFLEKARFMTIWTRSLLFVGEATDRSTALTKRYCEELFLYFVTYFD